jgi:hypothetical protein
MKKLIILSGIIALSILGACKKGDEDPVLSMLSRKERLTGVWVLSEAEAHYENESYGGQIIDIESDGEIETSFTFYTGAGIWEDSIIMTTNIINDQITFEKDGSWNHEYRRDITRVSYSNTNITTHRYSLDEIDKGLWSFANKTKNEFKNKERLITETLESFRKTTNRSIETDYYDENLTDEFTTSVDSEYSQTYVLGDKTEFNNLLRLTSKEMIWFNEGVRDYSSLNSESTSLYSVKTTYSKQ